MGAPFWSEAEKRYFLDHIVPRSHYANGYYEPNGRSFEELAPIMQRDLDDRTLSRRTYNGDLLFQHWYQKVRPTPHNVIGGSSPVPASLPATPLSAPSLLATPQQTIAQDSMAADEESSLSSPGSDSNKMTNVSDQHTDDNATGLAMAGLTSPQLAPGAEDNNGAVDLISASPTAGSASELPPPILTVTETAMEITSSTEAPTRVPSPSAVLNSGPARATKKRSLTASNKGDKAQAAPSKKPKKPKKAASRVIDSESDGEGHPEKSINPQPRSTTASKKMNNATEQPTNLCPPPRRFGPPSSLLPPQSEEDPFDDSPYRLRHPIPIPGDTNERERDLHPTTSSNPYTSNIRPGLNNFSFQPHPQLGSSSRHPLPSRQSMQPFTQEDAEVARLQRRHALELANNNHPYPSSSSNRYPPPSHSHGGNMSVSGGAVPGSGSAAHGNATIGVDGVGLQTRIDPVTGQRLGEVTLQGTVMMTYCPSCQRSF